MAAYIAYLAAWCIVAVAAVTGAIPKPGSLGRPRSGRTGIVIAGTVLQLASAFVITLSLPHGPLRPQTWELAGALLLAPIGAVLYVWALKSPPDGGVANGLVTRGAYALIRHPIYLAFFALLMATGMLASSGYRLAIAAALYLAGSEMRIAREEAEMSDRFPVLYRSYQSRTRWRYLPGLR